MVLHNDPSLTLYNLKAWRERRYLFIGRETSSLPLFPGSRNTERESANEPHLEAPLFLIAQMKIGKREHQGKEAEHEKRSACC